MICLALGLGVLGLFAARKARRCAHGGGCGGHHDHGRWRGWQGHRRHGWHRGHHARSGLYAALGHLDATPAQERAIVNEVDRLRERLGSARATVKDGRPDLAAAVRGELLDDDALASVLGRVDGATAEARAAGVEALRNIHALLDDTQRARLADLLDAGWWRRGGGPYRV